MPTFNLQKTRQEKIATKGATGQSKPYKMAVAHETNYALRDTPDSDGKFCGGEWMVIGVSTLLCHITQDMREKDAITDEELAVEYLGRVAAAIDILGDEWESWGVKIQGIPQRLRHIPPPRACETFRHALKIRDTARAMLFDRAAMMLVPLGDVPVAINN